MRAPLVAGLAMLLLQSLSARGGEPPKVWIKAKCAVCHGKDGSGKTDTGKKLNVRDLRAPEIQKLTDKELAKAIAGGHRRMPAFQRQVSAADIRTLLDYIRGLSRPEKK
jgi:mono/diheme cytochrome c family protein